MNPWRQSTSFILEVVFFTKIIAQSSSRMTLSKIAAIATNEFGSTTLEQRITPLP